MPKRNGRFQICPEPEIHEQVYTPLSLPYGVSTFNCGSASDHRIPHILGPHGGVSSCADSSRTLQISPFLRGKKTLSVQGSAVWPFHGMKGLYEAPDEPRLLSMTTRHSCPSIPGQPPDSIPLSHLGSVGHRKCGPESHRSRIPHQQGQEPPYFVSVDHTSQDGARITEYESIPHHGENTKDTGPGIFNDIPAPFIPVCTHSIARPASSKHTLHWGQFHTSELQWFLKPYQIHIVTRTHMVLQVPLSVRQSLHW